MPASSALNKSTSSLRTEAMPLPTRYKRGALIEVRDNKEDKEDEKKDDEKEDKKEDEKEDDKKEDDKKDDDKKEYDEKEDDTMPMTVPEAPPFSFNKEALEFVPGKHWNSLFVQGPFEEDYKKEDDKKEDDKKEDDTMPMPVPEALPGLPHPLQTRYERGALLEFRAALLQGDSEGLMAGIKLDDLPKLISMKSTQPVARAMTVPKAPPGLPPPELLPPGFRFCQGTVDVTSPANVQWTEVQVVNAAWVIKAFGECSLEHAAVTLNMQRLDVLPNVTTAAPTSLTTSVKQPLRDLGVLPNVMTAPTTEGRFKKLKKLKNHKMLWSAASKSGEECGVMRRQIESALEEGSMQETKDSLKKATMEDLKKIDRRLKKGRSTDVMTAPSQDFHCYHQSQTIQEEITHGSDAGEGNAESCVEAQIEAALEEANMQDQEESTRGSHAGEGNEGTRTEGQIESTLQEANMQDFQCAESTLSGLRRRQQQAWHAKRIARREAASKEAALKKERRLQTIQEESTHGSDAGEGNQESCVEGQIKAAQEEANMQHQEESSHGSDAGEGNEGTRTEGQIECTLVEALEEALKQGFWQETIDALKQEMIKDLKKIDRRLMKGRTSNVMTAPTRGFEGDSVKHGGSDRDHQEQPNQEEITHGSDAGEGNGESRMEGQTKALEEANMKEGSRPAVQMENGAGKVRQQRLRQGKAPLKGGAQRQRAAKRNFESFRHDQPERLAESRDLSPNGYRSYLLSDLL